MPTSARWILRCVGLAGLLVGFFSTGTLRAQPSVADGSRPDEDVYAEFSLTVAHPQGPLGENVSTPGLGGTVMGGGRLPGLPIVLLSEVGLLQLNRTDRVDLTRFQDRFNDDGRSTSPSPVTVDSDSKVVRGHLVARLQPRIGIVEPYVDGLVGASYFVSDAEILGGVGFDPRQVDLSSEFNDLVLSYGGGGGVRVVISDGPFGSKHNSGTLSVILGVRYLRGGEVRHVGEESLRATDCGIHIRTVRSRTDMLTLRFGVQLER